MDEEQIRADERRRLSEWLEDRATRIENRAAEKRKQGRLQVAREYGAVDELRAMANTFRIVESSE